MRKTVRVPNGIVFVFDPARRDVQIPEYVDDQLVAASRSCVSIGTQAPQDGEVEIALEPGDQADPGLACVYQGRIDLESGEICIVTAEFETLLSMRIEDSRAHVAIYVNDPEHPSTILVKAGAAGRGPGCREPTVRKAVQELQALGVLPSEDGRDVELVRKYEVLCLAIEKPVTDDEARVLVKLFGDDGCFGLAATLMHLIETAPGWPLVDCLRDPRNEWVLELRNRALRGGYRLD